MRASSPVFGNIYGQVTDQDGAVLPEARVTKISSPIDERNTWNVRPVYALPGIVYQFISRMEDRYQLTVEHKPKKGDRLAWGWYDAPKWDPIERFQWSLEPQDSDSFLVKNVHFGAFLKLGNGNRAFGKLSIDDPSAYTWRIAPVEPEVY